MKLDINEWIKTDDPVPSTLCLYEMKIGVSSMNSYTDRRR
jgi:hypothetical protein